MQPFRASSGGLIDRSRPIHFTFDGRPLEGYEGDTLASALLANDIKLVGRSFKYHRPRGILSAGPEEPNALVELREGSAREPNTRATTAELFEGLSARSQNRFPSLRFDLMSINGLMAPVLAAGFYYKTFMWPAAFWERIYEPLIRSAAGLGRASGLPDPDIYEKQSIFADVLVIGAGPAGLAAAMQAQEAGARVLVAEQDFSIGGRLLSDCRTISGQPASSWLAASREQLEQAPGVRILTRTTVTGVYDGGTYAAVERVNDHYATSVNTPRERLWRIVAPRAVLATGAIERPIVVGGNDLPGIMLAGAVRTYIHRYAVRPGKRAAVFTNNDDGASTMTDLVDAGIEVAALIDTRRDIPPALRALAQKQRIPVFSNATIRQAVGGSHLEKLVLGGDAAGTTLSCDLLAMSGGWSPTVHLASHHGGKPVWNEAIAAFVPGPMPSGMIAAGAAAGHLRLDHALATGQSAGREVVGLPASSSATLATGEEGTACTPFWQVPDSPGKAFVDFQNDVTAADIALAAREGFTAVEHLKRYTTLGMATDQGKTSNVTGLAIMAALTNRTIAETGTTIFRPPYTPSAIGAFAGPYRGPHYRPTRRTPAHGWAEQQGAHFVDAGEWLRASHFPLSTETALEQSVNREVRAVRQAVGFCDVSTLGKIDVQGPDAAAFLDFIYANTISTLRPGRARYALMLREDGFAFDDGTVSRLSDQHFLLTTTTANAAAVLRHLDLCHQRLKPDLDLCIEPVTDQWAQFALAGPRARTILEKIVGSSVDVGSAALPFMGVTEALLCGVIPGRLFRISFSGELAYEIAVPASQGATLARALQAAGTIPYGVEALNVLRLEKGHLVGAELNGQTTGADLGLGHMLSTRKDFVGRVLSQRPALLEADRPALVGLRPRTTNATLQAGAHLVLANAEARAANDRGHVTSAAYSPTLGHWIGLALLAGGLQHTGQVYRAVNPLQETEALVEIVPRVFHDPKGEALHG